MTDRNDPLRWAEGGPGAPEAFDALLRADESACECDAARLERVVDGLARELSQPELVALYRARTAGAEAGRSGEANAPSGSAGGFATAAPHGALILKVFGALLVLAAAATLWRFDGTGAGAGVAPPPRERPTPTRATAPAVAPPQPSAEDEVASPAAAPPSAAPVATKAAGARSPAVADPAAELALLEAAQRALRSDPRRALELAVQHGRRFPRGQFEQEREMLAIEALLRADREAAARVRARRFERRFPASSHLPRLHQLLPPRAVEPPF